MQKRHYLYTTPQGKKVTPSVYKVIMSTNLLTNADWNTLGLIRRATMAPSLTLIDLLLTARKDFDFKYPFINEQNCITDQTKRALRALLNASGFVEVTLKSNHSLYRGEFQRLIVPSRFYLVGHNHVSRYKAASVLMLNEWARYEARMEQKERRRIEKVKKHFANKRLLESTIFNPEKQTLDDYYNMSVEDFL